jgi:CRP-like cAMP-binding protein
MSAGIWFCVDILVRRPLHEALLRNKNKFCLTLIRRKYLPKRNFIQVQLLISFFLKAGFSNQQAEEIASGFIYKEYSKGEFFAEEGKTGKYLGFIEKGFFQYFINLDGEEKTTYSIGSNNLIASLVSFLKEVPARENIRAVIASSAWIINKIDFKKLQQSMPAFKDYYIGVLEWQVCCIEESRIDGIMLSAGQRYEKMMYKEPEMIRQIPSQYLASIIGVTPRHLSRIRNSFRLAN